MDFIPNIPSHVYNRGNANRAVFYRDRNYHYFTDKIRRHIVPHARLLAYALLPHHFHLLLVPTGPPFKDLKKGIGIALSSYTRALQRQECFNGSLFQQHTRADPATDPATFIRYLHRSPVRLGLVDHPAQWPFSSYNDYAGLRDSSICDIDYACMLAGIADSAGRRNVAAAPKPSAS